MAGSGSQERVTDLEQQSLLWSLWSINHPGLGIPLAGPHVVHLPWNCCFLAQAWVFGEEDGCRAGFAERP